MRVLVTGAAGFVGRYLCERLAAEHEVLAVDRLPGDGIDHALELPDDAGARALIERTRPEVIFHLAAFSSIVDSELKQEQCRAVNVDGTRSLLRALPQSSSDCRFIYVSSCAVYGRVAASAQPITERQPVSTTASQVYAQSKVEAENLVREVGALRGVPWLIFRPFNHFGPRQQTNFVLPSVASQIVAFERGERAPILRVGNLNIRRDFLDVRDVVNAYALGLAHLELHGIFNIATGVAYLLADLVAQLRSLAKVDFDVSVDPALYRGKDMDLLVGDASAFRTATGWRPQLDMATSLAALLDYFRSQVSGTKS
ncbi:MAG: NAD-dependent epimerase/dehydratase family protein [Planctomycetota bacterium]